MRKHILLTEIHRLTSIILESRVDVLKNKYSKKIGDFIKQPGALPQDYYVDDLTTFQSENNSDEEWYQYLTNKVIDDIIASDPDPVKKNSQWLLTLFANKRMEIEDLPKATSYLERYAEKKKKRQLQPEHMDLNRFKTLGDLYQVVKDSDDAIVAATDQERQKAQSESKVLLNNSEYLIFNPKTEFAAQYFGRDTEWCTAYGYKNGRYPTRNSMFEYYSKDGPLYIVVHKPSGDKWQFHFETNQFMDVDDRTIDLENFAKLHPEVVDYFENHMIDDFDIIYHNENSKVIAFRRDSEDIFIRKGRIGLPTSNGMRKPDAKLSVDNNEIISTHNITRTFSKSSREDWDLLLKILQFSNVSGGQQVGASFAEYDIFYKNGKWGYFDDLAEKMNLGLSGADWFIIEQPDNIITARYYLGGQYVMEAEVYSNKTIHFDVHNKSGSIYKNNTETISQHVGAFILAKKDNIKRIHSGSQFSSEDFEQETANIIVQEHPSLASLDMLLNAKGEESSEVQQKLLDVLDGEDEYDESIEHTGNFVRFPENNSMGLVLKEYSNFEEAADELIGNDRESQWMLDIITGGETLDFNTYDVDAYRKMELMDSLNEDDRKKLGEFVKAKFIEYELDDDSERFDEDYPDYDPSSSSSIADVLADFPDDPLDYAFERAQMTGDEVGAETEAANIVHKAFENNPYLYFKQSDGSLSKEFIFDTPVIVVAPFSEIIYDLTNYREDLERESWLDFREERLKFEQPYNGFTDFDYEAAKETFVDELYQNDILD